MSWKAGGIQGGMGLKTRLNADFFVYSIGTKTNTIICMIIHALSELHFDEYSVRRLDSAVRKRKKEHRLMKSYVCIICIKYGNYTRSSVFISRASFLFRTSIA